MLHRPGGAAHDLALGFLFDFLHAGGPVLAGVALAGRQVLLVDRLGFGEAGDPIGVSARAAAGSNVTVGDNTTIEVVARRV